MATDRDAPAVVVGKTYDLVLWLLPKTEKFPRSYRFSVGDRLVSNGSVAVEQAKREDVGLGGDGDVLFAVDHPSGW